jgi:hypothetical protein
MKLTYQSYGSSILLFIEAATTAQANGKYLSLFNWNATSSEAEVIKPGVIQVWSSLARLKRYLFNFRVMQLLRDGAGIKGAKDGVAVEARKLAAQDLAGIEVESFRSINSKLVTHDFGTIEPEDETEAGWNSEVVAKVWGDA